jgi:hypothetical protein
MNCLKYIFYRTMFVEIVDTTVPNLIYVLKMKCLLSTGAHDILFTYVISTATPADC